LATIRRGAGDLDEIARLAAEHEVIEVIVGLPTGLSGRDGSAARQAREFAAELAPLVGHARVRLVDERFTTVIAHEALRSGGRDARQRRSVVDQAAAALLLQSALDAERSSGIPAGKIVEPLGDGGQ
jgi:putative Holliday junction resolvase